MTAAGASTAHRAPRDTGRQAGARTQAGARSLTGDAVSPEADIDIDTDTERAHASEDQHAAALRHIYRTARGQWGERKLE